VLIGLAVDGHSTAGVVHLPCEGLTYAAASGFGAREIGPQGGVRTLHLDPTPPEGARPTVAVSREHYGNRTRQVVDRLNPGRVIASGSVGRKAMLVATGVADIYLTTSGRSRHWDACAAEVVVREAGGVFRDARGRELVYNTELTRNSFGLLACRSGLLAAAVEAVEAVLGDRA
jgi:3'-phosphoadenosine 5'-phosphosulfate (PAPS) 3'-phosphatase